MSHYCIRFAALQPWAEISERLRRTCLITFQTDALPGPILLDVTVWFILRAAMIPRFKPRALQLLLSVVAFFVCGLTGTEALAQRLPKATGREPENRSSSVRRERRPKVRRTTPAASRNPASVESDNFLNLGDTL